MKPVLYRYKDSESVIKVMDGYKPGDGWVPLYGEDEMQAATAAALERAALVWGGAMSMQAIERIKLPKPDTHCFDTDTDSDVWSYSPELVRETVLTHIDKLEKLAEERLQNCAALVAEVERLRKDAEQMREALMFYAEGDHFTFDRDAWDTVSDEPQNYWCDEAGTATVEDGTIAKLAIDAAMKEKP